MKNVWYLFIFSFIIMGCKSKEYQKTSINPLVNKTITLKNFYFEATGNEPFWNIKIGTNKITFTSLIDSFDKLEFEYQDPVITMNNTVKTYRLENAKTVLNITILQQKCSDSMSDKTFDYEVRIEIKKKVDVDFQKIMGCGSYTTDYRLHDIWSLDSLNGKKITNENFDKQKPYIEINSEENSFMGYAGCNTINGKIFSENTLLRFTNIVSTLKMCLPNNEEISFLKTLQHVVTYKIENNRLILSNSSNELLVFRKVD